MENEEKTMTGEESLRIITEMISKTQVNIRNGIFHLLFWGWLILFITISEYLLFKFTSYATPWYVWLFVVPGIIVSITYSFIKGRRAQVFTYADRLYMWTWMAFLFASIVMFIVMSNRMQYYAPVILTLAAVPTFISGIIIKFRPLVIGGICFWIFALVAHFVGPESSVLAVAASILTGYLIPGYILKNRVSHDKI
jgi:hypothetical protein